MKYDLNLEGWEYRNVKTTSKGLIYRLFERNSASYLWLTFPQIEQMCRESDILNSESFRAFRECIQKVEAAWSNAPGDFEKRSLRKIYREYKGVYLAGEIIITNYLTNIGKIASEPKLVKRMNRNDFDEQNVAMGVEEDMLGLCKRFNVDEIELVDSYCGAVLSTTYSKYKRIGTPGKWGKVYLPVRHFKAELYGNDTPSYWKYVKK